MKEEKVKINIRLGIRIRDVIDGEAAVEDVRIGTLANRLLQEELEKVMNVGLEHCVFCGSKEYKEKQIDIEASREEYYIFPATETTNKYIATQLDDKVYPQISFYFTPEQVETMTALVIKQRIPYTVRNGKVKSYRFIIAGMLLNHSLLDSLGASAN